MPGDSHGGPEGGGRVGVWACGRVGVWRRVSRVTDPRNGISWGRLNSGSLLGQNGQSERFQISRKNWNSGKVTDAQGYEPGEYGADGAAHSDTSNYTAISRGPCTFLTTPVSPEASPVAVGRVPVR